AAIAGTTPSFLAVTQGPRDVLWREGATLRQSPVFAVEAIDTLGAGDVFHGAFALALAERREVAAALRFAAAAAGLKCTRPGAFMASPLQLAASKASTAARRGAAMLPGQAAADRISVAGE